MTDKTPFSAQLPLYFSFLNLHVIRHQNMGKNYGQFLLLLISNLVKNSYYDYKENVFTFENCNRIRYLSKWYGIGNDNTILYTQILGKTNVLVLITHARRF